MMSDSPGQQCLSSARGAIEQHSLDRNKEHLLTGGLTLYFMPGLMLDKTDTDPLGVLHPKYLGAWAAAPCQPL